MILYSNAHLSDLIDSHSIQLLTQQIRTVESEDLTTFLQLIPPLSELIKAIPQSLPLLDLVYSKCEKLKNESEAEFPERELWCQQLFQYVLWFIAFNHEANKPTYAQPKSTSETAVYCSNFLFNVTTLTHLRSILGVINRECPKILEEAAQEKLLLDDCLESLGCHGLVNCSTGLIRIFDAVALEMTRHHEKMKAAQQRLKELQKSKTFSGKHRRKLSLWSKVLFLMNNS
ncbi:hypothetical protein L596_003274 [Steinernema carpocapsae]|uniref:Uncharacterized protein n=1 Tax=Steinernema carpocapsae TaxID=34508 RepID=A0A4U8URY4_STECR|nr:hypothetical protein L596_003274 [Steinernema carpocapsae]